MELAELVQAAQAAWSNVISIGALIITIVSGYRVVAYVAGRDVTRSKVVIVNSPYVLFLGVALVTRRAFTMRATEFMGIAVELGNERLSRPPRR